MEALGINLGYLFIQILNFEIMLVILYAWVNKPLQGVLERRRQTIAQGLEDARVAAEARQNAEREAERILNEAHVKGSEIIRVATARAEGVGRELKMAAEAEIVRAREAAMAEVEQERHLMLSGLRSQVAALTISAAQRLIGDCLMADEQRQHELLKEFFSGVRGGKIIMLEAARLSGASAEVTSALPLTEDEQVAIRQNILGAESSGATICFRVDPSILGGLVVWVGDQVVDGSVAGQLQELRQNLA
ncbi:MAG TPA: F0F1 ATP synthase subunit B [Levilinea sp.]|nr:F0F1 ATP synthase subunit B [Levilinea sp.]